MNNKITKILTSFETPQKECLMGNEAVARGAIEAGVRGIFSYPGTPSTEISEVFRSVSQFQNDPAQKEIYPKLTADPIYFEYSINEKVALEKGIAYSLGNRRAMCCMKSAGMNVASDPLMTITYQTIGAALVIVVCDDPGCFSSSNEQDSRYWGKMASVPVFNPATPEDAINMTKDAFALSELLKLPVIVRMTTRVSHSRGIVKISKISSYNQTPEFKKSQKHINIPALTAIAHKKLLEKLEGDSITPFYKKNNITFLHETGTNNDKLTQTPGIIASGVASAYALEIINNNQISDKIGLLKVGITHPFPSDDVLRFLQNGFSKVLILEELDPIVENEVRILAQKNSLKVEILGKNYAGLSTVGEYSLSMVSKAISEYTGFKFEQKTALPLEDRENFLKYLPPRPPALCPGCPHRATFYALKLAVGQDVNRLIMCGDIGCFGLGAFPPFKLIDTIHHMGMSISMAQGLSEAFNISNNERQKTVALVGDGTIFHSGIASLLNAVYTRANITVIIFDNRTIGMTGQQFYPGAVGDSKNVQIDLSDLLKGMGIQFVETLDPNEISHCFRILKNAMSFTGVAVVIAKSPCVFLPEYKDIIDYDRKIEVDQTFCNSCHNQEDSSIFCSKDVSAESGLTKARARIIAKNRIPANKQLCPANICNHEFFNAILTGDYKESLNIVRDKILFARVCGDLCPKPCEFMYVDESQRTVPIKKLKQFVAGIDQNFTDFSVQKKRTASSIKKNKNIAVVGAGPAGLSSAYDLIQEGYDVTVFEKGKEAGGLLKFAIPTFRMDKKGYDQEIALLDELGVEFRFNTSLGKDINIEKLADDFDAVIVAIGMGLSTTLEVIEKNVPVEKKYDAISFLQEYNEDLLKIKPASTLFVIGGGNSAIDAARAGKRFGAKVTIIYRRTREEMPAFDEEIEEAISEGVQIINHAVIDSCTMNSSGKINVRLKSFKDNEELGEFQGDYIITAIGQKGDERDFESEALKIDNASRIISDPENGSTEYKNVFVAGDICADNHVSVIGAIASGKKAATGVRQLLEKYAFNFEGQEALAVLCSHSRMKMKSVQLESSRFDESNVQDAISGFDLFQACGKCDHCIENFGCPALIKVEGKVVIDDLQCTRCGLCIDICLNDAINWV